MARKKRRSYFLAGYGEVEAQLWPHQREAVQFLATYVQNFSPEGDSSSRLVALPTGSGKSGIIATVSRFLPVSGAILVVVPRDELRRQLTADIQGRFFNNAKVLLEAYPRRVHCITRSETFWTHRGGKPALRLWREDSPEDGHILVTTIQLLEHIWRQEGRLNPFQGGDEAPSGSAETLAHISDHLIEQVGLVIFDEGHYEPAPAWAQVIRSFQVPRVVFTATPFRNDLRSFDWATRNENVFFRSFRDMVEAGRIRDIEIERLSLPANLTEAFHLIEQRRQELVSEFGEDVEVIVRVGSRARILEVADAVGALGLDYFAVHHRKTSEEDHRMGEPKIHERYPVDHEDHVPYWIHQFKLLEGIDRSAISMLVILDRLGSLRALVQQIGRLTRRSKDNERPRPYALVLDSTGEIGHRWRRHQSLEKSLKEGGFADRTPQAALERILKGLALSAIASPIYAEGNVRDVLNPQSPAGPWDNQFRLDWQIHVLVRRAAQVLEMRDPDEDWRRVCQEIRKDSEKAFDRMWQLDTPKGAESSDEEVASQENAEFGNPLILLGISSGISPFLVEHAFFDIKLDVTLAYRTDPYVFFFDSSGRDLHRISGFLDSGSPEAILQLLKQFEGQRLRSVSTRNTRMGPTTTSSRTLRGVDLTRVPSTLDEGTHLVTSAAGYAKLDEEGSEGTLISQDSSGTSEESGAMQRRYIGLRARRVSDAGKMIAIKEYCEWAEGIADSMRRAQVTVRTVSQQRDDRRAGILSYFKRFAPEADRVPVGHAPTWLLVDIAEYEGEYVLRRVAPDREHLPLPQEDEQVQTQDETIIFPVLESGLAELHRIGNQDRWRGHLDVVGGDPIAIEVTFKSRPGRYVLHSQFLDSFRPYDKPDGDTVLQELNQNQSFSIVPEEDGFFYTMGAFYRPGLGLGPDYQDDQTGLLEMMVSLSELRNIHSEKGKKDELNESSVTWPATSLFGLLDAAATGRVGKIEDEDYRKITRSLGQHLGNISWFVCDDMGAERADFIALTERGGDRIIVLIHAKAKPDEPPSSLSAKQLQEVCAQAIKNLDFLGPRLADHARDWDKPWSRSKTEGASLNRIRVSPDGVQVEPAAGAEGLSQFAHEAFERAVRNPSVRREVWLLLGASLEKAALDKVLRAEARNKQEVPPIYLLYATSAAVASSNALLRVFAH
jgi:superfamily II DNA or RNA helicase